MRAAGRARVPSQPGGHRLGTGGHSRAAGDCERGAPIRGPHAPSLVAQSPLSGGGERGRKQPLGTLSRARISCKARAALGRLHSVSCSSFGTLALPALLSWRSSLPQERPRGAVYPRRISPSCLPTASPSPGPAVSHRRLPPPNAAWGFPHWLFPALSASRPRCFPAGQGVARPRCPGAPSSPAGDRAARPAVPPDGHVRQPMGRRWGPRASPIGSGGRRSRDLKLE